MAGTKAQKANVLDLQSQSLSEADRLAGLQQTHTATEVDQAANQKADKMRTLGYLDSRVDELIQQKAQQAAAAQQQQQLQINQQALQEEEDEQKRADLEEALTTYQTAVQDGDKTAADQAIIQIQQITGEDLGTAENIAKRYFMPLETSTGQALAQGMVNSITLGDVNLADLGTTPEDLQALFGDSWASFTTGQLKDAVSKMRRDEFSRAARLKLELNDPATPSARRADIAEELKELSQLGVIGAEAQMENIERAIAAADTVEFMGETMTVEELLKDEGLSKMIERYVLSPEDSEFRKQFKEEMGGIAEWADTHSDALKSLSDKLGVSATEFDAKVKSNAEAKTTDAGDISDKLMTDLFGDKYGKWDATDYATELKNQGWYQALNDKSYDAGARQEFLAVLNDYDLDPEFADELKGLSKAEVGELVRNPDKFRQYVMFRVKPETFTDDQKQDADFLLDYLFGSDVNPAQIEAQAKQVDQLAKIDPAYAKADAFFDQLKDEFGNISAASVYEYVNQNKGTQAAPTIADFLRNQNLPAQYKDAGKALSKGGVPQELQAVWQYLATDKGTPGIDKKDFEKILKEAGEEQGVTLLLGAEKYMDPDTRNRFANRINDIMSKKLASSDNKMKALGYSMQRLTSPSSFSIEEGDFLSWKDYNKLKDEIGVVKANFDRLPAALKKSKYGQSYLNKIAAANKHLAHISKQMTSPVLKNIVKNNGYGFIIKARAEKEQAALIRKLGFDPATISDADLYGLRKTNYKLRALFDLTRYSMDRGRAQGAIKQLGWQDFENKWKKIAEKTIKNYSGWNKN
jgi:hypothetical protein